VGDITINGGASISASGGMGDGGAGIGGGLNTGSNLVSANVRGDIIITNATIATASNSRGGAGIGAGYNNGHADSSCGVSGSIIITDATITSAIANGSSHGGAGIGGGSGGGGFAGIGGSIIITGSAIGTITGGSTGAGIGGGDHGRGDCGVGGSIIITGGTTIGSITGKGTGVAAIGTGTSRAAANIVKINENTEVTSISPSNANAVVVTAGSSEIWIIGDRAKTGTYAEGVNLMEKAIELAPELEDNAENPFADTANFTIDWEDVLDTDTLDSSPRTFTATVKSKAVVTGTARTLETLDEVLGTTTNKDSFEELVYTFTFTIATSNPPGGGGGVIPSPKSDPEPDPDPDAAEDHLAYIKGYVDGTVHPDGNITRAEVAMIFWRLSPDTDKEDTAAAAFPDVADGAWYAQAVNYLAARGVLVGYEDGTYRPNARIKRAEFVAIIERIDANTLTGELVASDVPDDHWAIGYIISGEQKKWIEGYEDGTFRPESDITRAEAIKIVNAFLDRRSFATDLADKYAQLYPDLTTRHWGFNDVVEASVEHIYTRDTDSREVWQTTDAQT
jgi:hypothetical protein